MKTILSLTILLLFSAVVSAETVDITGVYEGPNTCGRSSSTLTVKIIHNPDNSVRVILSSALAGYTYGRLVSDARDGGGRVGGGLSRN
jgi:hypothetical protein